MSMPWTNPDPPTQFNIGERPGEVVLVVVGGYHPAVPTQYGEKPAARVTVVELTGRFAETVHTDVMVWGQLASQFINAQPGQPVLGRVSKKDKTVTLDIPSAYDNQVATVWMNKYPGTLDALRAEAVRNFNVKAAGLAHRAGQPVAPSPQYQPPTQQEPAVQPAEPASGEVSPAQAYQQPQGQPWQQGQPPNGGNATIGSMQYGATAATPEQAGY